MTTFCRGMQGAPISRPEQPQPSGGSYTKSARPLHRSGVRTVEFADVVLGVELHAELLDQLLLRLEEIDVALFVGGQLFKQQLRHAVIDRVAIGRGFEIERARLDFGGKIAAQDLFDVLADTK